MAVIKNAKTKLLGTDTHAAALTGSAGTDTHAAALGGTVSLDNLDSMEGAARVTDTGLITKFVGTSTLETLVAPVTSVNSEIYINVQYTGGGSANATVVTWHLRRDSAAGPILQTRSETVSGGLNQTINYRESPPSGTTTTYIIQLIVGPEGGGGAQIQLDKHDTLNGVALYSSVDDTHVAALTGSAGTDTHNAGLVGTNSQETRETAVVKN